MAVNSYKEDEQLQERSKIETMKRLFGYLLGYKWQVLVVLLMVGYGVVISLVNPIIMQKAVEIREDDTPESLQKRVMEEAEWQLLPRAVQLCCARIEREENENGPV